MHQADADSQYRIEASGGMREPRTRILKHGNTFVALPNRYLVFASNPTYTSGVQHLRSDTFGAIVATLVAVVFIGVVAYLAFRMRK